MSYFITNITLSVNHSEVSQIDDYDINKTADTERLLTYKWVAYVIGTLIVLSNIVVVISSGLILKKGSIIMFINTVYILLIYKTL